VRVPLFAANWKMNKAVSEVKPFMTGLLERLHAIPAKAGTQYQVMVAPPATHLITAQEATKNTPIQIGAQNCGQAPSGAFTGEISPAVLKEIGCLWVILGHSERRHLYLEDDHRVLGRLQAALKEGLSPILCVGETLPERKAGQTMAVVERQLGILKSAEVSEKPLVIAYEPVWAIGTGENATPDQAQEVHLFIRNWLKTHFSPAFSEKTRILYGGSVKPENSASLMKKPDVDGFLVGGASLEANSFSGIVEKGLKSRS